MEQHLKHICCLSHSQLWANAEHKIFNFRIHSRYYRSSTFRTESSDCPRNNVGRIRWKQENECCFQNNIVEKDKRLTVRCLVKRSRTDVRPNLLSQRTWFLGIYIIEGGRPIKHIEELYCSTKLIFLHWKSYKPFLFARYIQKIKMLLSGPVDPFPTWKYHAFCIAFQLITRQLFNLKS